MSTAQEVAEIATSVHVQSVPVTPLNSLQAVTPRKPAPRVGPSPISIPPKKVRGIYGTGRPRHPPFTVQERLIYVPVDILNIRVGALLDSGCSDNFISRTPQTNTDLPGTP